MSEGKPPVWFWVISGLGLLWNLMGVSAYIQQVSMDAEALALLPEAELALYESQPAWATGAFAIAVFAGALGCVALLLRKSWARPLLLLSLLGIIVQMVYNFFIAKAMDVYGPGAVVMPIMVLVIGIGLVWFSGRALKAGWIR